MEFLCLLNDMYYLVLYLLGLDMGCGGYPHATDHLSYSLIAGPAVMMAIARSLGYKGAALFMAGKGSVQ